MKRIFVAVLMIAGACTAAPPAVPAYRVEYVCSNGPDELEVRVVEKTIRVKACVPETIFASHFEGAP